MGKHSIAVSEQEGQKGQSSGFASTTSGDLQEVCETHAVCDGVVSAVCIVVEMFSSVPEEARVAFPTSSAATKSRHPTFTREVQQCIKAVRKLMPLNSKDTEGQWRILCAAAGLRMNVIIMHSMCHRSLQAHLVDQLHTYYLGLYGYLCKAFVTCMQALVSGTHRWRPAVWPVQPPHIQDEYEARWNSYPWSVHRPAKRIPFATFCNCVRLAWFLTADPS